MINILLADDHPIFIDGLKSFLEKENKVKIVGEAFNGLQVLEKLDSGLKVDIVILDIDMPKLNGVETAKAIRKNYPNTKVLIVTSIDKKEFIIKLMQHGASGYVLKNKTKEELLSAIHNIYRGGSHYSLDILNTATSVKEYFPEEGVLTDREVEVLKKIAEGWTSKEISQEFHISETTVNTHRRNILNKLDLPNTASLVRHAFKHKYVEV